MSLPQFRFTLSHIVNLPPFSQWETESGDEPWDIDATPSISLPGPASSSIEASTSLPIGQYTFDYDITITNTGISIFSILFEKNGVNVGNDSSGNLSGAGNFTGTFTIDITDIPDRVEIGFANFAANTKNIVINSLSITSRPTHEISEPEGWQDALLKLERHPTFHSLVEYFDGSRSFIFYGNNGTDDGGIDFIKNIERSYGYNADILIEIEVSFNEGGSYDTVFSGTLDLTELQEVQNNKLEVPIVQTDLWTTFIARKDTPINLRSRTDLDGLDITPVDTVDLDLTSQKIRKVYEANMVSSYAYDAAGATEYFQFDWDSVVFEELKEKITLWRDVNPELPQPIFIAKEAGIYNFDIRLFFTRPQVTGSGELGDPFVFSWENLQSWLNVYIKHNNDVGLGFTRTDLSSGATEYSRFDYTGEFLLNEGDTITIYADPLNAFTNLIPGSQLILIGSDVSASSEAAIPSFFGSSFSVSGLSSYINITADTTYRQTSAQGYLLHDAFAGVIQAITGENCFYSEYFGSTTTNARQYDSDGCGWKNYITKGLQIRGYTLDQKPISWSFKDLWEGANPMFNLCLFYDTIDGEDVIRVEPKDEAFDKTSVSHNFDNVYVISREYDHEAIYNKIEVGYKKWESEDISGLDDTQGKRTWATIVKKITNALQIVSDFIAASLAIEVTRRTTVEQSADFKYDNETFIVAISGDDVSPDRYVPELDENFDSISGLLNSETRYNNIHTPLRMLLRWGNWWNRGLQKYQSSDIKFVSGEANYDMESDYSCGSGDQCLAVICDPIAENDDLPLGEPSNYGSVFGFLHLPDLYKIEINLSWEEYLSIRNNREQSIGISMTESNHTKFFIKDLKYELCKSKAEVTGWPATSQILELIVLESNNPAPTNRGWNHNFSDEELNCNEIHYRDEFVSDLENWTSDGGDDIPASELPDLQNFHNEGELEFWTYDTATNDTWFTIRNGIPGGSNPDDAIFTRWLLADITTIVGLSYEFDFEIDIQGTSIVSARIEFALLDANLNVLSTQVNSYASHGTKTGTVTFEPESTVGVYFGIRAQNRTEFNSKGFEIISATLSGGTGASAVPLPSWAWNSSFGGSAKAIVKYDGYGVKNFVIDGVTFPDQDTRVEIKYALPVNNGNNSLRFKILDASDVAIYETVFASNISQTSEQTAIIDITSSLTLSNGDKFEISVESSDFQINDTIHINELLLLQCIQLDVVNFDDDYQSILDYATGEGYSLPSDNQKILQNQLLLDLKAIGVWSQLDILYVLATDGDRGFAKINWKNPQAFYCAEVNSPTFTENEGFTGNGSSSYLNTGWVPSGDAVNFTLDEGGWFIQVLNEISASPADSAFGARDTDDAVFKQVGLLPKSAADFQAASVNSSNLVVEETDISSIGFFHGRRVADDDLKLFKDGSQVSTSTNESTGLSNAELYILASSDPTSILYSTAQVPVFAIGASLTGLESGLYTAWNDYFTSL